MRQWIRASITLRTLLLGLGVALGIGLVANEFVARMARRFEEGREQQRILALLAVVEPSAGAACFAMDYHLAKETAKGLLNSPSIAAVAIRGTEDTLAELRRPGGAPAASPIVQVIESPFSPGTVIGRIQVYPDLAVIDRNVTSYIWPLRAGVLLMALVVGAALTYLVLSSVVRPIKHISDVLTRMEANPGLRLELPPSQELNEIGRLVTHINQALAGVEERHRLEKQMETIQAQKMTSLGSLAGGVAHDYNNMLAAILTCSELLESMATNPKQQRLIQIILSAAKRSSELTSKLLAFGRRGKNRVISVALDKAVEECLAMLQPSLPPDLQVITNLEPGLCVDGDPSQIDQVLLNLCINATEAMPGQGRLTLTTCRTRVEGEEGHPHGLATGAYAELRVSDTGIGMDEDVIRKIFEPFFTTKAGEGKSGTGLGLATVYGIVESHKGRITVTSDPGQGSTFRVLLPLGRLAAEAPTLAQVPLRGQGVVLVVDDEQLLREGAKAALESLGFTVKVAQNGLEGLHLFQAIHERLEAVLLDLKMPIMDGKEAFLAMRAINPKVPIIICTGYGENEEVQTLLNHGSAGMLAKPYQIRELAAAIGYSRGALEQPRPPASESGGPCQFLQGDA